MLDVLDLDFQDTSEVIASYLVRGPAGFVLIETGPASTFQNLKVKLNLLGIELAQISHVLVTHIHLDHAGAAGWVARESGATVHVHHVGARHLADPSRLLASASRIYGDLMDPLWGETIAVPAGQVHALQDGDVIEAAGLRLAAVDTPGHAYHHMSYLLDGLCFTGDVAGVRLPGQTHLRLPTPPPEIDIPAWKGSLFRLQELQPDRLLPTHFGPVAQTSDPIEHLDAVGQLLDIYVDFVRQGLQEGFSVEAIGESFAHWVAEQAAADGADADAIARYEVAVPSFMEVPGLIRYLRKFEQTV
ncbi:MAG: MBL fold metallo-hydrolase [Chloroflexota bacterium]|nr:MBL fold metallo-hydrolase [Chloroflexota bacterium]